METAGGPTDSSKAICLPFFEGGIIIMSKCCFKKNVSPAFYILKNISPLRR
jgi:hypothetical protein